MNPIRIAIADDHRIFTEGLQRLLDDQDGFEVLWTAQNGKEALHKISILLPQVLLLDIQMPEMNGIDTLQELRKLYPELKVLILSMHKEKPYLESVFRAGAHGYLLKNAGNEELVLAIETVCKGGTYYAPAVTEVLLQSAASGNGNSPISLLTKREIEVLTLIAQEFNNPDIAEKLFLSVETVNSHRKNLLRKLDVKNTAGLVKAAMQMGLV